MYYLDYELQQYQEEQDATCVECGGCLVEEYYDCSCDEEEDDYIHNQINYQRWWLIVKQYYKHKLLLKKR